jgi:hypothetical protein
MQLTNEEFEEKILTRTGPLKQKNSPGARM